MFKSELEEYTYHSIRKEFPYIEIKENIRPPWFTYKDGTRLEIDLYIPEFEIAIEIQGQQHYRFIEHFHKDQDGFKKRLEYDEHKRFLCDELNIHLYEVASENDVRICLSEIKRITHPTKAKRFYLPRRFKNWKYRIIRRIVRFVIKRKYQEAIRLFNELNSILVFNKKPMMSWNGIRKYSETFFQTPEDLFGKKWSKKVDLKTAKRIHYNN